MSTTKFCSECSNILYPKEDRERSILLYACRTCGHEEVAVNNYVYRSKIRPNPNDPTQVLQDPTLPLTKSVQCPKRNCKNGEAVFFEEKCEGKEGMTLFFVCCNPACGYRWTDDHGYVDHNKNDDDESDDHEMEGTRNN